MTDRYTDELFALPAEVAVSVVFAVSRLAVDPEPFTDDADEPMARKGMGIVYTRTARPRADDRGQPRPLHGRDYRLASPNVRADAAAPARSSRPHPLTLHTLIMASEDLQQPLTDRFTRALTLACDLHRTQARKGTQIPYVAHLLAVASIALEHGAGEDEAIGAVLHDAVEDQGGPPTLARIREEFGDAVAEIVAGCTDADEVPKPPWRERKEAYVAKIASKSAATRLVSASDKLHNARAILADYREHGEALWDRFTGGREGTLWYYPALADAFARAERTRLTAELERTVAELERLAGA
jgi:hypothetical protein